MFTPNNCQLPGQNWYFYIPSLKIRGIREIVEIREIGEIKLKYNRITTELQSNDFIPLIPLFPLYHFQNLSSKP